MRLSGISGELLGMSKSSFREQRKETGLDFYGSPRVGPGWESLCTGRDLCGLKLLPRRGALAFLICFPRCTAQGEELSAVKSDIQRWSRTPLHSDSCKILFSLSNWRYRVVVTADEEDCSMRKGRCKGWISPCCVSDVSEICVVGFNFHKLFSFEFHIKIFFHVFIFY